MDLYRAPSSSTESADPLLLKLEHCLRTLQGENPSNAMVAVVAEGAACLPLPGDGKTLARWQSLARVAEQDLALAKLYEGHTDALAILAEIENSAVFPSNALWSVWAADSPPERLQISSSPGEMAVINGSKSWCSGAEYVEYALCTAWRDAEGPYLVAVALDQSGVSIDSRRWNAVGMALSGTCDVRFKQATAFVVGSPGAYLDRPGFWHGAAGIAACWYGGAIGLAKSLWQQALTRSSPFVDAHLGAIDVALAHTGALLRETAVAIDLSPSNDSRALALRCRASAEATALTVLNHVGQALGATPFCRDRQFARLAADLPVFIRQSHADRDLAALATTLKEQNHVPWRL